MTPFTLDEHILLISKPIWMFFVDLDVLGVELHNHFEAQKQLNNDKKSLALDCKPVLLA